MSKRPGDPGYAPGWCIHYRGISDGKGGFITSCEKGVEYSTFRNADGKRLHATQPCFLDEQGQSKPGALSCEHLRRPTPDEIAAHEEWVERHMQTMRVVFTAIKPWRQKNKGRSFAEVIECPACKGQLHLSISSYNGHVHGACETKDCVSWME